MSKSYFVIIHNHTIHYKHLLFNALVDAGGEFTVIFTALHSKQRALVDYNATAKYSFTAACSKRTYEEAPAISVAFSVWRHLCRLKPSVVVISGWCDAAAWTAFAWSILNRRPRILWAESNKFDKNRIWGLEAVKRVYVQAFNSAHVYGISNLDYLLNLGMSRSIIRIKRAVLDTSLFRRIEGVVPRDSAPLHFVFVGRFAPEKGLEVLVTAFARAVARSRQPMHLKIVGFGPLEGQIRTLIAESGAEEHISMQGPAKQEDLPAVYSASDVLVLPSESEPWGLVVAEAMNCGLPAVVSNVVGCAADLVKRDTGWIFRAGDVEDLEKLFLDISKLPRKAIREMGESAKALASTYTAQNCAAIVLESVRSLST